LKVPNNEQEKHKARNRFDCLCFVTIVLLGKVQDVAIDEPANKESLSGKLRENVIQEELALENLKHKYFAQIGQRNQVEKDQVYECPLDYRNITRTLPQVLCVSVAHKAPAKHENHRIKYELGHDLRLLLSDNLGLDLLESACVSREVGRLRIYFMVQQGLPLFVLH
jgi:hypothetical protein